MFVRKIIAALLLGIYGIPAAVGPHWHQHDHCGPACAEAVVELPASSCCGHHHHRPLARNPAATIDRVSAAPDSPAAEDDGLCAVCQFYATAAWQSAQLPPPVETGAVILLASWRDSAMLTPLCPWPVRGPPHIL